ncbi:MAG: hypothetical protein H7328_11375 [Bdellovibrio sp.]|nr:hypothetical protein [Bdellovibrio sp.]
MKKSILLIALLSLTAHAQDVGVKLDNVNAAQETTISIKKGDVAAKKKYTLSEGEEEITGDKEVVMKSAEKNWKTACTDWKKEFKEMNKENKVVSMTCGRMKCSKEDVESTCSSTAKYKVKVLSEE